MKKTLLAAAIAATSFGAAAQSSVTLYGTIDAGVASVSNAGKNNAGSVKSETTYVGALTTASDFGLRGSEEITSGLKGIFDFQAGLNSGNGALDGATHSGFSTQSTSSFFDRDAFVGLEGTAGALRLGRVHTTAFDIGSSADAVANVGAIDSSYLAVGAATGTNNDMWNNNTVRVDSASFNGASLSANYALGGQAGSASELQEFGFGAKYENKIVSIGAALQSDRDATGQGKFRTTELGGKVNVPGNVSITALYQENKLTQNDMIVQANTMTVSNGALTALGNGQQAASGTRLFGLGASVACANKLTFAGEFYNIHLIDDQASTYGSGSKLLTLFGKYSLSNRTSAYVDLIDSKSKDLGVSVTGASSLGSVGAVASNGLFLGGMSQHAIGLGVTHLF